MINDLASLTLYLISKIGKKIKVTRPGYEKSKLLGSLDNWEPGQLSRIQPTIVSQSLFITDLLLV